MKGKRVVRIIGTALVISLLLAALQRLLTPKYMTGVVEGAMIEEYYGEPKDHDVIFIGDCEVYENFSPAVLWEEYGINSYIRGSAEQLIWQSYYLAEDTFRYEKPQVLVFNVLSLKYNEPQKESYNRMTLDGMRWSRAKIDSIRASMTEEEHFVEYVFPLLRYHSRWNQLTEDDFTYYWKRDKVTYNGYYMRVDVLPAEGVPQARPLADYTFGDNAMAYLDRLRELCSENGVELVLIKAPSLYPCWYEEWDAQVEDYAKANGLKYYNFLECTGEVGLDFSKDTYDGGLHLNLSGAEKLSSYFGRILADDCGVKSRRGEDALEAAWNAKLADYQAGITAQRNGDIPGKADAAATVQPDGGRGHGYLFEAAGTVLGADMDMDALAEQLGEAKSIFHAPSCAGAGIANIYDYGSYEVETYPDGDRNRIAFITLKDDTVATAEGIDLSCTKEQVIRCYGEDYTESGRALVYRKDGMKLMFLFDGEDMISIEYSSSVSE